MTVDTEVDAVVVGSRCAGASTAMLLARNGHRVLLLDRVGLPSDTRCTLHVRQTGVAALARWGVLQALDDTGCPPIERSVVVANGVRVEGCAPPVDGIRSARGPRRHILDGILTTAARDAGATVLDRCTVQEVLTDGDRATGVLYRDADGRQRRVRASVVIGADGVRSVTAESVRATTLHEHPTMTAVYYAFFSGLEAGKESYSWSGGGVTVLPTHDDLRVVTVTYRAAEFNRVRRDAHAAYLDTIRTMTPDLWTRLSAAQMQERLYGVGYHPNFVRQAAGLGWALVGDAGVHRDPATGQGMSAAFAQAQLLADTVGDDLKDPVAVDSALQRYAEARDKMMIPEYHTSRQVASLEVPPQLSELMRLIRNDQDLVDAWLGGSAGTVSREQFRELLYARHPEARARSGSR